MINFVWHEGEKPDALLPVTQVYGVCFNAEGNILLLRQSGQGWNIPGGTPEAGETPSQTLMREVYEETTVQIGVHEMIGYQEALENDKVPYYQLRYAAIVERIDPQKPDPDKGAVHERLFVSPNDVMNYITYPQYRDMFDVAVRWWKNRA